jgi:hypothetical protein
MDLRDFVLLPWCEICVLLGLYAALNGSLLRTFRDILSVPRSRVSPRRFNCMTFDYGANRLSRNVGSKLLFYFA